MFLCWLDSSVDIAEATAALCAENILEMIEAMEEEEACGQEREREAGWELRREGVEGLLTGDDKDDLSLSAKINRSIIISLAGCSAAEERLGREIEILALFMRYRSTIMTVQMDRYHEVLSLEMRDCARSTAELALGQVQTAAAEVALV